MGPVWILYEPVDERIAAIDHAKEIHVEDPPPVIERKAAHLTRAAHAGVVDEQVDPLPLTAEPIAKTLPLGRKGHVEPLRLAGTASLLDERHGLESPGVVDIADRDMPAVAGQPHRQRPAQAAGRSGDQCMPPTGTHAAA